MIGDDMFVSRVEIWNPLLSLHTQLCGAEELFGAVDDEQSGKLRFLLGISTSFSFIFFWNR